MRFLITLIILFSISTSYSQIDTLQQSDLNSPLNNGLVIKNNPYSKGLGQRIAGGVLTGFGAINIITGCIFDATNLYAESYKDAGMGDFGNGLEKAIWIEGIAQVVIGLPLLITGVVKYDKWKSWENENNKVSIDFKSNGYAIVFNF